MKKDLFLIFSERLKYLRENCQLTQKELSDSLKKQGMSISEDMISSFERGITEPKFSHITSLCNFFNTTPDFLYGFTQIPLKEEKSQNLQYDILYDFLDKNAISKETYDELLNILCKLLKTYHPNDNHKNSNL